MSRLACRRGTKQRRATRPSTEPIGRIPARDALPHAVVPETETSVGRSKAAQPCEEAPGAVSEPPRWGVPGASGCLHCARGLPAGAVPCVAASPGARRCLPELHAVPSAGASCGDGSPVPFGAQSARRESCRPCTSVSHTGVRRCVPSLLCTHPLPQTAGPGPEVQKAQAAGEKGGRGKRWECRPAETTVHSSTGS